jgi:hypothetical protein
MGRVIIAVAFVALHIYALIDLVRAESASVRFVPKWLWFVLWVIPVLGPIAWLLVGRPRVGPAPGGGGGGGGGGGVIGPRTPRGPIAPDDDPEFLKRLDEQSWAARMERLRREREAGAPPTDRSEGESAEDSGSPAGDPPSDALG